MNEELETFLTGALSEKDFDACVALIKEGGAITDPETAAESLPHCLFVVVKRDGDQIIGVGAIKGERPWYAASVARKARFQFNQSMHELGYVVVKESHQGNKYSKDITTKLLSLFPGRPLFATTSHEGMKHVLEINDFVRQGATWPNKKQENLHLLIKP